MNSLHWLIPIAGVVLATLSLLVELWIPMSTSPYILVLYYSRQGRTRDLARRIASGIEAEGMDVRLRTVPSIASEAIHTSPTQEHGQDLICTLDDLAECSGLALGSPTRFGQMAAALKFFLEGCSELWLRGALIDKPAAVFTSSQSAHGGQESTLLSMMLPLLHHGMVMVGLPYDQPALSDSLEGGSPYGAGHIDHTPTLSISERQLAHALGQRLARWAHCKP